MAAAKKSEPAKTDKKIASSSTPIQVTRKKPTSGPQIISHKGPRIIKPIDGDKPSSPPTTSDDVSDETSIADIGKPSEPKQPEKTAADITYADGHINVPGLPNVEDEGSRERIVDIGNPQASEAKATPAKSVLGFDKKDDEDKQANTDNPATKEVESPAQDPQENTNHSPTTLSHGETQIQPLLNSEAAEHLASQMAGSEPSETPAQEATESQPNAKADSKASSTQKTQSKTVVKKTVEKPVQKTTPNTKPEQNPQSESENLPNSYKVPIGGKGKSHKQLQRKRSAFKINKKILALLMLVLLIGGLWLFLQFWFPKIALAQFYARVVNSQSLNFDAKLDVTEQSGNAETSQIYDISSKGSYENGDQDIDASSVFSNINDAQPQVFADQKHYTTGNGAQYTAVADKEAPDVFGNSCGVHELPTLMQTFFNQAAESNPSINLQPVGLLVESRGGIGTLHYQGVSNENQLTEAFSRALEKFESKCTRELSAEQIQALETLIASASLTVDYWYGWSYDEIQITSEADGYELTLNLIIRDYNRPVGIDAPVLPKANEEVQPEEECDATCRDEERKADIDALNAQIKIYIAAKDGQVPNYDELLAFVQQDEAFLIDPDGAILNEGGDNGYQYEVSPEDCDNSETVCIEYVLSTTLESGEVYQHTNTPQPTEEN